jgi:5-methyltetrahydrofolate corrinoid/iron sulfur protein methyltransferase
LFVIAENINVMRASVAAALRERDKKPIQELARTLVASGVDALDVNLGPARKDGEGQMSFLVESLAEVASCQLCLDTTNAAAMEAGIVKCREVGLPKPIINSFSLQPDKLEKFLPLAAEYGCEIIGLTMESSIPITAADRLNLAFELVTAANEAGISNDRILIDPVVLPLGVDVGQQHALAVREVVGAVPEMFDPPVRTVCGLSNVSNGAPDRVRSVINCVYAAMLAGAGLTCVIGDGLDGEFMRTVRLVRALNDQSLYSMSDAELQ